MTGSKVSAGMVTKLQSPPEFAARIEPAAQIVEPGPYAVSPGPLLPSTVVPITVALAPSAVMIPPPALAVMVLSRTAVPPAVATTPYPESNCEGRPFCEPLTVESTIASCWGGGGAKTPGFMVLATPATLLLVIEESTTVVVPDPVLSTPSRVALITLATILSDPIVW
jgi:hypothetical protein